MIKFEIDYCGNYCSR